MKSLRSVVLKLVIGSFAVAALLGIVALLGGGGFGETEAKILLTTVIVGVESVAVLCYLAVAGRSTAAVGALGGLVSLVPFGIALWLTWIAFDDGGTAPWRTFGIGVTVAASLAQVCLLLALRDGRLGVLLLGTLGAITVVASMIVVAIVDGSGLDDWFWRIFGVVAILDVLGTITVAALAKFGRGDDQPAGSGLLTPSVEHRLLDAARSRGTTPDALVSDALDRLG